VTDKSPRLSELLAALSHVSDLGMGHPLGEALHACVLATRLGEKLGLDEDELSDVYFTALLAHIGCNASAHETALLFGGDEIEVRRKGEPLDHARPAEVLRFFGELMQHGGPFERMAMLARAAYGWKIGWDTLPRATCDVGAVTARRLGLSEGVQTALKHYLERWDGKGRPRGLAAEEIPLAARVAQVAAQAVLFERLLGAAGALQVVRERAGSSLDPRPATRLSEEMLTDLAEEDVWEAAIEEEPGARPILSERDVEVIVRAFADLSDLKAPFSIGHSSAVAELAEQAGRRLGLDERELLVLRRASLLHDLGKVGVPGGTLAKEGPLTRAEWENVRLHPYHTGRILAASTALSPLVETAWSHHERLDGGGYDRALGARSLPMEARVLAAANAFEALLQDRPYRRGSSVDAAADALGKEVAEGRLDGEAVRAVLEASGGNGAVPAKWPCGLTSREVEVLRLAAAGKPRKQIASELGIAAKTADNHLQHAYRKIDVSTRASAALFVMEHGLLPPRSVGL
jgi:HD-GYP domain-containing protein (c-di-GMP phosphodiesterase class II)/DNA-binding CsgD family transcriptional regulator